MLNDLRAQEELEIWHTDLLRLAAELCAQGVVNRVEHLELRELADAAYSHHVEDQVSRELTEGKAQTE
ncbi:hypothetical protein [Pseudomonas japonica]|uniref:hypothetical protein n=1 Tax=Pseudomonas japonica TaxID=256466 RepID=UPI0015E4805E|nr:hypothetical protein [Pseudomonas japonica]MBA1290582.1 hypothetical protein [Pseudomonas japonica]